MNLLTRDTDYAVRALVYLVKKGKRASTSDMEKELFLPRPFLRRILQILQKNAYLASAKGHEGGFELLKKPEGIRILDLMEIFQNKFELCECLFKKKICPDRQICPLRKKLKNIETTVKKEFHSLTLQSLLETSADKNNTNDNDPSPSPGE